MERSGHEPNSSHYRGTRLEGLRKSTRNVSQHGQSLGRHLNPGPSEDEACIYVLITRSR
jgi:hypothetical protein